MHDDLSQQNILVDKDNGKLTAVVDWECVSALPLWKACQLPEFLESRNCQEKPVKENYSKDEDGETNELYWEVLMEYEQTQLRSVFLEGMKRIEPGWVDVFENARQKADFELAVQNCDSTTCLKIITKRLDEVDRGDQVRSLKERLTQ